jgi:sulfur carrier protein ThiS
LSFISIYNFSQIDYNTVARFRVLDTPKKARVRVNTFRLFLLKEDLSLPSVPHIFGYLRISMEIQLTLHGILRDYLPRTAKGRTMLDLPPGTTVGDVVLQLNIKQNVSAAVDGVEVDDKHVLSSGEALHLFRFIAGG